MKRSGTPQIFHGDKYYFIIYGKMFTCIILRGRIRFLHFLFIECHTKVYFGLQYFLWLQELFTLTNHYQPIYLSP